MNSHTNVPTRFAGSITRWTATQIAPKIWHSPSGIFQAKWLEAFMTTLSDFKETVRQQADIVRVIGDYIQLKKAGAQNFIGLCPFHGEKTPSFSVHATRQFFHCFGCGKSGDVFKFVQEREQISFPEAIRLIAEKMGIPLPRMQYSSEGEAEDAQRRGRLIEMHERGCKFFEDQLRRPEGAHAREYLAGRGL
jgi:DNA primase